MKLNLTTNGTFPRLGAEVWAERIVPVTSDVKISWNGATKATHERVMVGADWERCLANARTFIEVRDAHAAAGGNRCRVTLPAHLPGDQRGRARRHRAARGALGVDRVKGHHLWAHFDAIADLSMRRSPDAIRRWNAAVRDAEEAARANPLPDGRAVLLENIFPLDEDATQDLAPGRARAPSSGRRRG